MSASGEGEEFVASLDVGTTTLRCFIFDKSTAIRGQESAAIRLEYPKPGWVEMDPEALWENVLYVLKGSLQDGGISPTQLRCMSVTCQRSSFLLWDTTTSTPITPLISWKDTRSSSLVSHWNSSLPLKSFRFLCRLLYSLTKNRRYLAGSLLTLRNELVLPRLLWVLANIPHLSSKIALNQVRFGTLDTWLIHRLTSGEKHVTDFSAACVTGFFDPWVLSWADWALRMFSIPSSILPKLVPSCGPHFGSCSLWGEGVAVPILACVADQSASMFGSASFHRGAVKVTLGTGAFLDVNTGERPHASVGGIYPLVGWKYGGEVAYIAEGQSKDNGNIVEWGARIGLYASVGDSARVAGSVEDSDGTYFVPSFNGLQAPYNDTGATSGFLGMSPTTSKAHLARALLESLAFRVQQLLNILEREADFDFEHIKVDGGVANNDFVLQTIANLTGKPVIRPLCRDMTALGSAFMAGVNCGFWSCREELEKFYRVERVFYPIPGEEERIQPRFAEWERALERFLKWRTTH